MKLARLAFMVMLIGYQLITVQNAFAGTKTIAISPGGFLRDLSSANIISSSLGLRWKANQTDQAGFYLSRPTDWDGKTPVKVHLTFALGGNGAGSVNWRMKLNTYTPGSGEWLTNPGTRDADTLLTFASGPSWYRIYTQTFTIQAPEIQTEPVWSIYFLRGNDTNSEVFAGDLFVLDTTVEYMVEERRTMFPLMVPVPD